VSISVFGIALSAFISADFFSDDYSYFELLQAKTIAQTGFPDYDNSLVVGSNRFVFMPLYEYLLGITYALFRSVFALKILQALLLALIPVGVFRLSYELRGEHFPALLSAMIGGFVPVIWQLSSNSFSKIPIVIILMLFSTEFYLKSLSNKKFLGLFYISFIVLSLTSNTSILFVCAVAFSIFLSSIDNKKINGTEIELLSFCLVVAIFIIIITYGGQISNIGTKVIWLNTPNQLLSLEYQDFNLASLIYSLGIFPMIYGSYSLYLLTTQQESKKRDYVIMSFILMALFLLWLKMVPWKIGFSILGTFLAVQFTDFFILLRKGINKSKISRFKQPIYYLTIVFFIIGSLIPSAFYAKSSVENTINQNIVNAIMFLKENSKDGDAVAIHPKESHFFEYLAFRKVILDSNYIALASPEGRYFELEKIFSENFETNAREILDEYNITYIFLTQLAKKDYNVSELSYAKGSPFFEILYDDGENTIYKYNRSLE
jgi:hypothetical protein